MDKNIIRISKFLSLILRHKPEQINLKIDKNGWANIEELIEKANTVGLVIDFDIIKKVVDINDKKRFKISTDGRYIRANQGHSINIDVELKEMRPPLILYHGTTLKFIESIKEKGLIRGKRLYVHLSPNIKIARSVGKRHGEPIVLGVNSNKMYLDGYKFYLSENLVWLTERVLPEYLDSI